MVVHFGEGSRVGRHLASDVLMDLAAESGVGTAVLLRGVEGFGIHHRLRTDRLLSTSEDLPLVLVALDSPTRIVELADRTARMLSSGLLVLERATVPGGQLDDDTLDVSGRSSKLTVYCGRAIAVEVAAALRAVGLAGAIVLTGVDGLLGGLRGRGRVLSRNREVPTMVIAVGTGERVAGALPRVRGIAGRHLAVLERVSIVRREGVPVGPLPMVPHEDDAGLGLWQRLTVIGGSDTAPARHPLHTALIRDLRAAGGPGATALRGSWAYTGDDGRHADRLLAIRHRSPVLVTVIARPAEMLRLWPIVERATDTAGLVTCELLPAVRVSPPEGPVRGGLALADSRTGR